MCFVKWTAEIKSKNIGAIFLGEWWVVAIYIAREF